MLFITSFACLSSVAKADDYFAIFGIPDHDQRRINLPGKGSMYCAPTSGYNLVNYMGTHGVPSLLNCFLDPLNLIYDSNPYKGHDLRLLEMGAWMDTDPVNGTNGSGYTNGLINYIEYESNVPLIEISYDRSKYFPSPGLMLGWMKIGGLVAYCYGRYSNPYGYDKERDGGHCLTLSQVKLTQIAIPNPLHIPWMPNSYNKYQIGYRDPWSDEGTGDPNQLYKQSTWDTTIRDTFAEKANFHGTETVLYGIGSKPADASKNYAYIDGYRVLLPLVMLTNKLTSANFHLTLGLTQGVEGNYIERLGGFDLEQTFDPSGDFALDPVGPSFVFTKRDDLTIYQSEYVDGSVRPVATAVKKPTALLYGGQDQDLFVLQEDRVAKLNRNRRWTAQNIFKFRPEAITWDPFKQQLLLASNTLLLQLSPDLKVVGRNYFRALGGTSKLNLKLDPRTGDLYAMRQGLPAVQRFTRTDTGFELVQNFQLKGARSPQSFDFGGKFIFVSDGGQLLQYGRDGRPARGSPFNGAACGPMVKFAQSYTNYDPLLHPLPAWRNIEDPEVPLE